MKILFIGDYSNLHATLAKELRVKGHEVTLISDRGGYMDTHSDIFLDRKSGLKGSIGYLFQLFNLLPDLKGYDVVQLVNSNFLKLRPGKIKYFFDRIRQQNGSMFLSLAGNDYYFVKACHDAKIFRFSEFKIGDNPTEFLETVPQRMYGWISEANKRWSEYLYEKINGAMSVLPEYDMAARPVLGDRLVFTNLPIDLSSLPYSPLKYDGVLKLFIGMRGGMEIQKGTKYLLTISKELEREMPGKIEVECVRNLPLKDYLEKMKQSHIVLDQFYSYSPGMNALQAMALGKVAGTGAQKEYYEYLDNPEERPIFSLSPLERDTKERLGELAVDPSPLYEMSRQGRKLVEEHNEVSKVTDKFIRHWERLA